MRRDRSKTSYKTERESLKEPHEEAEIQREALRRGKILVFSEDTCLENERVRSKVTPTKVGPQLAWWGFTEKKEASHLLGFRGKHQHSDRQSSRNRAPCVASTAVRTEGHSFTRMSSCSVCMSFVRLGHHDG